jgi:hypothetical protein
LTIKSKRAKAEALRASVAFAERQAALLKQEAQMKFKKAEIKADLTLLESRRIAAVAQTESDRLDIPS